MSKRQWYFFGGILAGVLAIIILCTAALTGGLTTYLLMGGQAAGNGQNTVIINARQGWQSTGVRVTQGMRISIEVINGEWTYWRGVQPYNSGEGGSYICARALPASQCVEPLPDFPNGGLIGQIGSQTFAVGRYTEQVVEQSGLLQLRINDGDDGLSDNDGELSVEIIVLR